MSRRWIPRPFGPYPVERGGRVRIPVRSDDKFYWVCVSPQDYRLAMSHVWRLDRQGYPITTVWCEQRQKATHLYLHRLVVRAPAGWRVDHRRHDILDCRRRSLRRATPAQNSANTRRRKLGCTSRYRGVTLHKTGKWQAGAGHMGRFHYCGLFETQEEAAEAYNRIATKLWGEFAILNRLPRKWAKRSEVRAA